MPGSPSRGHRPLKPGSNPARKVMRRFLRYSAVALALLLLVLVGVALSLDWWVKTALVAVIRHRTGWETSIERVDVGIRDASFRIQNLVIENPPAYGGGRFLHLPELYVAYDRAAAATNALHLLEVRFDLAEVNVVVDARGRTNITELQAAVAGLDSPAQRERVASTRFTGIDTLVVTLGTVAFKDLRPPGSSKVFVAGLRGETLHNVHQWVDLLPIGFKTFMNGRTTTGPLPPPKTQTKAKP